MLKRKLLLQTNGALLKRYHAQDNLKQNLIDLFSAIIPEFLFPYCYIDSIEDIAQSVQVKMQKENLFSINDLLRFPLRNMKVMNFQIIYILLCLTS